MTTKFTIPPAARVVAAILFWASLLTPSMAHAQATAERQRDPMAESEEDTVAHPSAYQYIERSSREEYDHSRLQSSIGQPLGSVTRVGNISPSVCSDRFVHAVEFNIKLDLGEEYQFGANAFSADAELSVDLNGAGGSGITHAPIKLKIDQNTPEQLFHVSYHGADSSAFTTVTSFDISLTSYSASANVQSAVRLSAWYTEEDAISATSLNTPSAAVVDPVPSGGAIRTGNPVHLEWTLDNACDTFPSYQLQVLRLYNIDSTKTEETEVRAKVDWNQALTVETPDGGTGFDLTLAEGTGYYLWRVRPIGSFYPGGIADARNWGVWSAAPAQGSVVDYSAPDQSGPAIADAAFFYSQFDDDKSWVYNRGFVEGGKAAEGMIYMSDGGMPRQAQTRIQSTDSILASQAVTDYSGRSAVGSLAAPVGARSVGGGTGYFGYVPNMLAGGEYTAKDFDADGNFRSPASASGGAVSTYYSSANADKSIPSAEGYPFAQSFYSTDGTGRMAEQAGVGSVHRLGGSGGGKDRTLKVYYSGASDMELVRLFGDEAPIDSTVRKVLTLDPNKVTSIRYMSREGQVIATALQRTQGDTLLTALNESNGLSGTISDTIRGNRAQGGYGFSSNKRLSFTDSTNLTISYSLTPDTVSVEACGSYCTTCDYHVRVILHDVDNPQNTREYPFTIAGSSCGSGGARSLDTTIKVPPGTYIVERRAETYTTDTATITAANPYGSSYAAAFRGRIAHSMDSLIRLNDTLLHVFHMLDTSKPDFDSLYRYLNVNPDSVSSKTIHTACCDVVIPIINPKCGSDPCRDSIPDFEALLVDTWKDKFSPDDPWDLNFYFKHDGQARYQNPPVQFPKGKGAFNTMVQNMLQERLPDSSYAYDCATLWNTWDGIVRGFESQARKDPNSSDYNPDFDLLESFLDAVGHRYIGISDGVHWNIDSGYYLYAYKYIDLQQVDPNGTCEIANGYNAGWLGNVDSSGRWQDLYACYVAKNRQHTDVDDDVSECMSGNPQDKDSCLAKLERKTEGECLRYCELKYDEFLGRLFESFRKAGQPLNYDQAACAAGALVDSCKNNCQLTIFTSNGHADSLGSPAEWLQIYKVFAYTAIVAPPDTDGIGAISCPIDSASHYSGWRRPRSLGIIQHLNQKLAEFKADLGPSGGYWNFKEAMREVATQAMVDSLADSVVFVPYQGGARFLSDGCVLKYHIDSIGVRDSIIGTPLNPHPMVGHLNKMLDAIWQINIQGSVFDCHRSTKWFDSTDYVLDYRLHPMISTAADDTFGLYFNEQFNNVNGNAGYYPMSRYLRYYTQLSATLNLDPTDSLRGYFTFYIYSKDSLERVGEGDCSQWNCTGNCDEVSIEPLFWASLCNGNYNDTLDQFDFFRSYFRMDSTCSFGGCESYCDSGQFGWYDAAHMYINADNINTFRNLSNAAFVDSIGRYEEDAEGYLVFRFRKWNYDISPCLQAGGDTSFCLSLRDTVIRTHFIRFALPVPIDSTWMLHTNICDSIDCPSICLKWGAPDSVKAPRSYLVPELCQETAAREIRDGINRSILNCIDGTLTEVDGIYRNKCGNADSVKDRLVISYPIDYYHFTLYYYDRAGNLVKTVPPKGVNPLAGGAATRMNHPAHTYITEYEYNGVGQLIRQRTPDAGTVRFWYDQWSRPRFSQDQRQSDSGKYSYVKYDRLGRQIESGVSADSVAGGAFVNSVNTGAFPPSGTERTFSVYDVPSGLQYLDGSPQHYLLNRVSQVYTDDGAKTYYSYDPHGNVEWVAQELPGFPRINYLKYSYELISDNVTEVRYNEGRGDQFYHRYEYDKDSRVIGVKTSRDGQIWDLDTRYGYNKNGSIRRREVGEDKLQGLDFTYTIGGGLKAVNHPSLTTSADPGADGSGNTFAPDSFAVAVGHYAGDFVHTGSPVADSASSTLLGTPLYDGGISSTMSNIGRKTPAGKFEGVTGETYRYDQLDRLKSSGFQSKTGASWTSTTQYATSYAYDANGNLDTLKRNAFDSNSSNAMDNLRYSYTGGTNKLDRVTDAVTGEPFKEDINSGQSTGNYQYDGNGNLTRDLSLSTTITWTAAGKVKQMKATPAGRTLTINYKYDGRGNRVMKEVSDRTTGQANTHVVTTYYVYDAAGNVVAIYEKRCEVPYDSDLDGKPDSVDKCPYTASVGNLDSDGDGVGDACDNCINVQNANQSDIDRDGKGDACDNAPNFWNPVFRDRNKNGVDDALEPGVPAWDTDGDGFGDNVDPCPTQVNTPQNSTDTDGDAIPDFCDNCPTMSNHSQRDINKLTPQGQACEPGNECTWLLVEQPIYGIAREGVAVPGGITLTTPAPDSIYTRKLGEKLYELNDHLGNARVTITDRKLSDIVGGTPGQFRAEMRSYTNLYPFGMEQPGRYMNGDAYRYGYNGMEQDSTIADDRYTTYFRMYDARLGRWMSIDPITNESASPFVGMGNNPVLMVDPWGSKDTSYFLVDGQRAATITNDDGTKRFFRWKDDPTHRRGGYYDEAVEVVEEPGPAAAFPNMSLPYIRPMFDISKLPPPATISSYESSNPFEAWHNHAFSNQGYFSTSHIVSRNGFRLVVGILDRFQLGVNGLGKDMGLSVSTHHLWNEYATPEEIQIAKTQVDAALTMYTLGNGLVSGSVGWVNMVKSPTLTGQLIGMYSVVTNTAAVPLAATKLGMYMAGDNHASSVPTAPVPYIVGTGFDNTIANTHGLVGNFIGLGEAGLGSMRISSVPTNLVSGPNAVPLLIKLDAANTTLGRVNVVIGSVQAGASVGDAVKRNVEK